MPRPARKPGAKKPDPELAAIDARIREAEKAQAPVKRELVPLDKAGLERLATCVERGIGKKQAVLAQALAIGLQALVNTTPNAAAEPGGAWLTADEDDAQPQAPGNVVDLFARQTAADERPAGIAATALGGSFAFQQAPAGSTETETQRRRRLAAEGGDATEPEEDEPVE